MPAYICLYCICCAVNIAWLSMMHLGVNMMVAVILVVVNMTWPEEHMGTNMVVVVKVIVEVYQCKNSKNRPNRLHIFPKSFGFMSLSNKVKNAPEFTKKDHKIWLFSNLQVHK